jgi:uncharacterized protein
MHPSLVISLLPLCSGLLLPKNVEQRPRHNGQTGDCQSTNEVVKELNLQVSSEKGFFVQTFQDPSTLPGTNRSVSTAIYYLLDGAAGYSLWHKLDAAEVWHYYAGASLSLHISRDDGSCVEEHVMGQDLAHGQRPQVVVNRDEWQRARSHGEWTLVGTTGKRESCVFISKVYPLILILSCSRFRGQPASPSA